MRPHTSALVALLGLTAALAAVAAPASAEPHLLFDRPLKGEQAVKAVRGKPGTVGARNRTSAASVIASLRKEDTVSLDRSGRLLVADTELPAKPAAKSTVSRTVTDAAPYPHEQTFRLHSRAGARRVLHLDFDGSVVSGTAWNDSYGLSSQPQPAFDTDGDPGRWSAAEHDVVQSVFRRVAEDFAPFDVDVTTEDPGEEALFRSSVDDDAYGARVLITPGAEAHAAVCGSACGGVAFVGVFDGVGHNGYYSPAWVFSHVLWSDAKYIADVASHEAGHNLGLWHHGASDGREYYEGHGNWAPIMGIGYYRPLVQWSAGDYAGASRTQDDIAVMQSYGLPLRDDDHASSVLGKSTSVTGVIENRADSDTFLVRNKCDGDLTVTVSTSVGSPNLDVRARLRDAGGRLLAVDDPASGETSYDVASGLNAALTSRVGKGSYTVEVEGVGSGENAGGYSDYGSLGAYYVDVSGCSKKAEAGKADKAAKGEAEKAGKARR